MKIGTKSVLFGAHCFAFHPFAVALGWWKIHRWKPALRDGCWPAILDPRAWLVFAVHDLGYIGKPNMDGLEGELHPYLGAKLVTRVLGGRGIRGKQYIPAIGPERGFWLCPWGLFSLLHSRHLAKMLRGFAVTSHLQPSRLCAADKMAWMFTPWWLYLPGVKLSGELQEYLAEAQARGQQMGISVESPRAWYESMRGWCKAYAEAHADDRDDAWTGDRRAGESDHSPQLAALVEAYSKGADDLEQTIESARGIRQRLPGSGAASLADEVVDAARQGKL